MVEKTKAKSLTIQYFSDLHLEMMPGFVTEIPVVGDVLVLAGDIGCIKDTVTREFLAKMSHQFNDVVYVTGNHEYYQTESKKSRLTVEATNHETEEYCKQFPNLHFLNKSSWTHPSGVTFHGCTLWSKVPPELEDIVEMSINDYNLIYTSGGIPAGLKIGSVRKATVADTNKWHEDQLGWLKYSIEETKTERNVVVTHHMPSMDMTPDKHKGQPTNCAFGTDLNEFIITHPQITAWVCGHSHDEKKITIGSTNIYEYCIGYFFQAAGRVYNSTFTIS